MRTAKWYVGEVEGLLSLIILESADKLRGREVTIHVCWGCGYVVGIVDIDSKFPWFWHEGWWIGAYTYRYLNDCISF